MPMKSSTEQFPSGFEEQRQANFGAFEHVLPANHRISSIVIADRYPVLAQGFCALMSEFSQFKLASQTVENDHDLGEISGTQPDVLILDPSQTTLLPSGLVQRLTQDRDRPALIGFCAGGSLDLARNCIDAGFRGFLSKSASLDQVLRAVRVVCEGGVYLDEAYAGAMLGAHQPTGTGGAKQAGLSEREEFVLKSFAQGQGIKEIANFLRLSPKTVDTYKARAIQKLGLQGRPDIIRHAIRTGWMQSANF